MDTDYYEIQPKDIGKITLSILGGIWLTVNFIGVIMEQDVGKRVYRRGGILQVENDEQRARRLRRCS